MKINDIKSDFNYNIYDPCEDWFYQREFGAYKRYTKNGYYEKINEALRCGCTDDFFVVDDIKALDKLFDTIPNKLKNKNQMVVYRGAPLTKDLEKIINRTSPTDIYTDKAYVSTSKDKQVAKRFALEPDKVLFEIIIPRNSSIIDDEELPSHCRSLLSTEQEVLLPRNTQLKILDYDPKTKKVKAVFVGQKKPTDLPSLYEVSGADVLSEINKILINKADVNPEKWNNLDNLKNNFDE